MNRILDGMTLTEAIWLGSTVIAVTVDLLMLAPVALFIAGGYPAINAAVGIASIHFGVVAIAAVHTPIAISRDRIFNATRRNT